MHVLDVTQRCDGLLLCILCMKALGEPPLLFGMIDPAYTCVCLAVAVVCAQIMGRTSVDIIKSGGYKLSALDIESALLHHPGVAEAAVLGAPDEDLGQVVMALVYPKQQVSSTAAGQRQQQQQQSQQQLVQELQQQCDRELPSYSVPKRWLVLDSPLPRNAMGKLNKKELLRQFVGG